MSTTAPHTDALRKRQSACERLKERLRADPSYRLEDLLAEQPFLLDDVDTLLGLILAEMSFHQQSGHHGTAEEWETRIRAMAAGSRRLDNLMELLSAELKTLGPGASPAVARSQAVPARIRIGRYQVLEEIGRGGMGVVYKARQSSPGRIVAIKMILAGDHANAQERAYLRNEAEAAAKLTHPNIVQIIDADFQQGPPYLVMEYVDGGNLARMIRSLPQPFRWSARLIETLARAIHTAHGHGIVHRDLNPTNILMTQDGVPKISDFGLAKFLLRESEQTPAGKLLGTPPYMAPEQVSSLGHGVGPHTDVYALGAILYELLTGAPPFRGLSPMETLCQVAESELIPPSKIRRGLPEDLETICLTCLDRQPASRYPDAYSLAEDLRRFQNQEPIQARRTPRIRRAMQWAGREPQAAAYLILIILLLLTLLSISGLFIVSYQRLFENAAQNSSTIDSNKQVTEILKNKAETDTELARRNQYDHHLGRIYEHAAAGDLEVANEEFEVLGQSLPSRPGFEWGLVDRMIHQTIKPLSDPDGHRTPVNQLAATIDGRFVITGDLSGKILEWDAAERKKTLIVSPDRGRPVLGLAAFVRDDGSPLYASVHGDPSGTWLSIWADGPRVPPITIAGEPCEVAEFGFCRAGARLALRRRSSPAAPWRMTYLDHVGREWIESRDDKGDAACAAFTPDSRSMALGLDDGTIVIQGVDPSADLVLTPAEPGKPVRLAFSSDGESLASAWDDGSLIVWDVPSGRVQSVLNDFSEGDAKYLAFGPSAQSLLVQTAPRTLLLQDLAPGGSRRLLSPPAGPPESWATSFDGDALAIGYEAHPVELWNLNRPESPPQTISRLRSPGCLRFAPAGALYLNFHQPLTFVWKPAVGPGAWTPLAGHQAEAWALAFSPNGRILASGADDHQIKLWDVETGTEVFAVEAHSQTVSGLAFSPSGEHLASVSLDGAWKIWKFVRDRDESPPRLTLLQTLRSAGNSQLRCVAYAPDGTLTAASGLTPDILINSVPGYDEPREIPSAHSDMITALAFSPHRSFLASSGCDFRLKLLNLAEDWRPVSDQKVGGSMLGLAFSPNDGLLVPTLAAGGDPRQITMIHGENLEPGVPIREHPNTVRSLAFSRDGLTLASACDDGGVRLCDVETRQVVLTLRSHRQRVNAVAFSPTDNVLASCSHSGEVFLWKGTGSY